MSIINGVIPGRDEVASPESIHHPFCGPMDSGFSLREPGLTAEKD